MDLGVPAKDLIVAQVSKEIFAKFLTVPRDGDAVIFHIEGISEPRRELVQMARTTMRSRFRAYVFYYTSRGSGSKDAEATNRTRSFHLTLDGITVLFD